jgi:hypothetical protein
MREVTNRELIERLIRERDELKARVNVLEDALRPFADQAETFDSLPGKNWKRDFVPDEFEPAIVGHTIGDLRRARTALQEQSK